MEYEMSASSFIAGLFVGAFAALLASTRMSNNSDESKGASLIMFRVQDTQLPVDYSIDLSQVTGKNKKGSTVKVTVDDIDIQIKSSNEDVLKVTQNDEVSGSIDSGGEEGVASFEIEIRDNDGNLLATESKSFTVAVDKHISSISPVSVSFAGLTEEADAASSDAGALSSAPATSPATPPASSDFSDTASALGVPADASTDTSGASSSTPASSSDTVSADSDSTPNTNDGSNS
jgi:hypothetical protein